MRHETVSTLLQLARQEIDALDARLLLQHATGLDHAALIMEPERVVERAAEFKALLARRIQGEPVSRIMGAREFYGRQFKVSPAVLDPRPDTETLIDEALARMGKAPRILDLGTGSGAIIITLLAERADATGVAVDISPAALDVARANAQSLGVADRLTLIEGDWFAPLPLLPFGEKKAPAPQAWEDEGRVPHPPMFRMGPSLSPKGRGEFDLIISNPPYIPKAQIAELEPEVRAHDPHMALDGGGDGLDAYRRISAGIGPYLAPGGHVIVEIGAGQENDVAAIFKLPLVSSKRDLGGHIRCLTFGGKALN